MNTGAAHENYWCPTAEGTVEGSDMLAPPAIAANEWIALLKISTGDWSLPANDFACLLERKLIEITAGFVHITDDGYVALGLPV